MYRYFFVPYAGGSSATFNSWKKKMSPELDFQVIELAGHGRRIMDDFYEDISQACEEIYGTLKESYEQDGMEYMIGGHCLGAILAVEVTYLILARQEIPLPKAVVVSGHGSLKYTQQKEKMAEKTQEEIVALLQQEGGLSQESMQEEILNLLVPVIRADAALYESYRFDVERQKLPVDLIVMYATHDSKAPVEEVMEWNEMAGAEIRFIEFETDHYFILHEQEKYISAVKKAVAGYEEGSCQSVNEE